MKKGSLSLFIFFSITGFLLSQDVSDSLVLFSDLKYHSEFERIAFHNFVNQTRDTFNLFLAIDEKITSEEARKYNNTYMQVFDELNQKKIDSKKINKKIKIAYSTVHNHFLKKYYQNEYYPVMFQTGKYNCVSASMIYSLVFDKLKIPYKVMASSNHVYLVANPGPKSIVIETTNPSFEKAIFTGEFKQQYAYYLRGSKLISENDYRNKSAEEIFEEKFYEVKEAEFYNLPGIQYYNKAFFKFQNHEYKEAYELCQKAYFFYPDQQVKTLLFTTLLFIIEKCSFDKVSDIDYIAHFARFENSDLNTVVRIFNNLIAHNLQYIDKEEFCDSLFHRVTSQISDEKLSEEISFAYFMQMSYCYQNTDKVEYYVENALKIKGNHYDANLILANFLHRKLNNINDSYALADTIKQLEKKYNYERILPILKEYEMIAYLRIAGDSYRQNKIQTGEKYLGLFEDICTPPINSSYLGYMIESTYRSIAVYYFYRNNKTKATSIVNRGLKYLPNSDFLKSAVY